MRTRVVECAKRDGGSEVAIMKAAVGIAQLAEHRTVAPTVAGSIPVSHPRFFSIPSLLCLSSSLRSLDSPFGFA